MAQLRRSEHSFDQESQLRPRRPNSKSLPSKFRCQARITNRQLFPIFRSRLEYLTTFNRLLDLSKYPRVRQAGAPDHHSVAAGLIHHSQCVGGFLHIAITDHGDRLREGRLEEQLEQVEALNARLAPFRILTGVESAIRADGSLDLPDEQLARLDWVFGALHTSFERSPTARILGAMENPHVDCIAHPTARKIGQREPEVEIERLVARAVETGTALEINGQPDRLDLRDTHARLAGEAGAKIVISSDGHRPVTLMSIELGLAQARRAWLTSEQVLNTRPWERILHARKSS